MVCAFYVQNLVSCLYVIWCVCDTRHITFLRIIWEMNVSCVCMSVYLVFIRFFFSLFLFNVVQKASASVNFDWMSFIRAMYDGALAHTAMRPFTIYKCMRTVYVMQSKYIYFATICIPFLMSLSYSYVLEMFTINDNGLSL